MKRLNPHGTAELLGLMTDDDREITATVLRERTRLGKFIRRRVRDRADADHILQDVFSEFVEAYRLPAPTPALGPMGRDDTRGAGAVFQHSAVPLLTALARSMNRKLVESCQHPRGVVVPVVTLSRCEGKGDYIEVCPESVFRVQRIEPKDYEDLNALQKSVRHRALMTLGVSARISKNCGRDAFRIRSAIP